MPKDKVTGHHQHYAFVEMKSETDAAYAMKVLNMIKLNGKSIRINHSSREREGDHDIGANLFVGNLDRDVDDQVRSVHSNTFAHLHLHLRWFVFDFQILYNTFSAFGQVLNAKSMVDIDGEPRGFGFVHFATFESADAALEAMNGLS